MKRILFVLAVLLSTSASAGELLVRPSPAKCVQGLYPQPPGGPFSVFLFCDDAAGMNIGVINTSGGAGPGKIELPQPKIWNIWQVYDRFWQEQAWSADITSFAWSGDLKYLYVATSGIYGTGAVFKLDLLGRTYQMLFPDKALLGTIKSTYTSEITGVNPKTGKLTVVLSYYSESEKRTTTKTAEVK